MSVVSSVRLKDPSSNDPTLQVASPTQITANNIFHPRAGAVYRFERVAGVGTSRPCLVFKPEKDDALFYSVRLQQESGKNYITLTSSHVDDMEQFLLQNGISIDSSDGNYRTGDDFSLYAIYSTCNIAICRKLSTILLAMNHFDITGIDAGVMSLFTFFSTSNSTSPITQFIDPSKNDNSDADLYSG